MSAEALANGSLRPYFTLVNTGIYVVMGVSGSGKSLIGSRLARALDLDFVEGDDFHSTENIERMSSGIPLTDTDRTGWLSTLARRIRVANDENVGVILSCSALKRAYRDILRAEADNVQFIFLRGSR
ncbi:MAG TPA: gluconokinase, GntK/IdnK-type, partial [Gemmatimonadaceae bacterium]|nr:gluconokinase, GntK/IdnK-type [Gemmatimonadaceae bacterium]